MVKYDVGFKIHVVREYLDGKLGYKLLAKKYDIPDTKPIREWVKNYQLVGIDGLERKRTKKNYTSEFKLEVLHYMKKTGASYRETSIKFGILNSSMIVDWNKKFLEGGVDALSKPKGRTHKDMTKKSKETKQLTREQQLEEENRKLRLENEYLKKLRAFGLTPKNQETKSKRESSES